MEKIFAPAETLKENTPDGGFILRSPQDLAPYGRALGDFLEHWGRFQPGRVFLAERAGEGWRKLTYGEVLEQVKAIAQNLLERGLGLERPLAILSDNSINHALLALAAMHVGIPVAPISPAYSLMSQDHAKLHFIIKQLEPGLIYAEDKEKFAKAVAGLKGLDIPPAAVIYAADIPELAKTQPGKEMEAAFRLLGPQTMAKILYTSGSTGFPKGVINTQEMLCANQQAIHQLWPFLSQRPPVLVDWLPWNHTFGGNHNFNMVLRNGGTLYIDGGKPAPALVATTVRNLKEISPVLYFNVPRGYDMLIPYLEEDKELRKSFFHDLELIFYAGAALPQNLWDKLKDLAALEKAKQVFLCSAWGSTETAPMVTSVHFDCEKSGIIGLPGPGSAVKFVPNGGKLEMRVKGPNVTPGYFKRDDLTKTAFDKDGYYLIGDAGKLADEAKPEKGIVFDGRIAEDFKLMSGTWVHVGALRVAAIAGLAPVVEDAVVCGHDKEEVGLLAFASLKGCLSLCPDLPPETSLSQLVEDPRVRGHLSQALAKMNATGQGSASKIMRILLMSAPPSIDKGEITDKGYINQRGVLSNRADLVEALYGDDKKVIKA